VFQSYVSHRNQPKKIVRLLALSIIRRIPHYGGAYFPEAFADRKQAKTGRIVVVNNVGMHVFKTLNGRRGPLVGGVCLGPGQVLGYGSLKVVGWAVVPSCCHGGCEWWW